ncbi:MAG: histidinol dehydrogenase [Spirochaetia bacterium]|jgi:histidinol dehydrogenase|nr:histidinol dehydrogenase [Spirochaetia bacterium]
MKPEILVWDDLTQKKKDFFMKRSESDISEVMESVLEIIKTVKDKGDKALLDYTLQFDGIDLTSKTIKVSEEEFESAEKILPKKVQKALRYAVTNIKKFHETQKPSSMNFDELRPGLFAGEKAIPIESAGLYVPRGRGSFPSMLYMLAIPAAVAGVERVCVITPPGENGEVDPGCLYAAKLCGIDEVYRVGGAHGIAALAYGTESIKAVHKITGPGSMYVTAAKRLLYGTVDVGLPAGPSESIILADGNADPWNLALDLLVEAEHGSDSSAILVTNSKKTAETTANYIEKLISNLSEPRKTFVSDVFKGYGAIFLVSSIEKGADLVNAFAPEHLQLKTKEPFSTLSLIKNAGEILLGENIPFSAANYVTGVNAVLPTGGNAKTYSAVSVRDFIKYSSVVYVDKNGYENFKDHVITLADYEGFETHGNALKLRGKN